MQLFFPIRPTLLFVSAVLMAASVQAQFGLSTVYRFQGNSDASLIDVPEHQNGIEFAADYWFRLPKQRIEFLPTISYASHEGEANLIGPVDESLFGNYTMREIGFQFKTNIYLFDLGTDCNCPTWGKQGPALHKGFFLQIAPGINRINVNGTATSPRDLEMSYSINRFVPRLGVALGVDFGISNLVTLTPIAGYRHYFAGEDDWDEPLASSSSIFNNSLDQSEQLSHFHLGLRLGIRLDEKRY